MSELGQCILHMYTRQWKIFIPVKYHFRSNIKRVWRVFGSILWHINAKTHFFGGILSWQKNVIISQELILLPAHSGARKWKFWTFSLKVLTFLWIASGATLPILTSPLCWMNIVSQVKLPWMIGGSQLRKYNIKYWPFQSGKITSLSDGATCEEAYWSWKDWVFGVHCSPVQVP